MTSHEAESGVAPQHSDSLSSPRALQCFIQIAAPGAMRLEFAHALCPSRPQNLVGQLSCDLRGQAFCCELVHNPMMVASTAGHKVHIGGRTNQIDSGNDLISFMPMHTSDDEEEQFTRGLSSS
jgi:hypothetical protein